MKLVSILPTAFFVTFVLGAVTTGAIAETPKTPSPQLTSSTPTATAKPSQYQFARNNNQPLLRKNS